MIPPAGPKAMMTATPRVEAFLRRYAELSDAERREMQSTPEFEFLMARLRFGPDESVPVEQMDLALELAVRYPEPLDYYRTRAEASLRRRLLAARLALSVPFRIT